LADGGNLLGKIGGIDCGGFEGSAVLDQLFGEVD
jgi:hypothetical protein